MGVDERVITDKDCSKCREQIMNELRSMSTDHEKYEAAILELKIISSQQAQTQQQISKLLEKVEAKQTQMEERLNEMEKRHLREENERLQRENEKLKKESKLGSSSNGGKQPIWKEKWFVYPVITLCIVIIAIVGVAIGTNIFNYLNQLPTP